MLEPDHASAVLIAYSRKKVVLNKLLSIVLILTFIENTTFAQSPTTSLGVKELAETPSLASFKTVYRRPNGYINDIAFEPKSGSQGKFTYQGDKCFIAQDVDVVVEGEYFVMVVEKMTPRNPADTGMCEGIHSTIKIPVARGSSSQNGTIFFKGNSVGSNLFVIRR